ncbi:hypothetical protein [Trichloromonas sp.]|uniref:hypothetical protein n=1 Tax=Trichloromonas sp. TaxID=3069249 RepID=UPI003D81A8BC
MTKKVENHPLFTISPSLGLYLIFMILIFLLILPFFVFYVTLPVLTTGLYEAVWPVNNQIVEEKMHLFYISFVFYICLPTLIPQFRVGTYSFYDERMEIKSFLTRKNYVIKYDNAHVLIYSNRRIVISENHVPGWFDNPIKHIINEYFVGFIMILFPFYYEDSSNLKTAIELLKQKSASFSIK